MSEKFPGIVPLQQAALRRQKNVDLGLILAVILVVLAFVIPNWPAWGATGYTDILPPPAVPGEAAPTLGEGCTAADKALARLSKGGYIKQGQFQNSAGSVTVLYTQEAEQFAVVIAFDSDRACLISAGNHWTWNTP